MTKQRWVDLAAASAAVPPHTKCVPADKLDALVEAAKHAADWFDAIQSCSFIRGEHRRAQIAGEIRDRLAAALKGVTQ